VNITPHHFTNHATGFAKKHDESLRQSLDMQLHWQVMRDFQKMACGNKRMQPGPDTLVTKSCARLLMNPIFVVHNPSPAYYGTADERPSIGEYHQDA